MRRNLPSYGGGEEEVDKPNMPTAIQRSRGKQVEVTPENQSKLRLFENEVEKKMKINTRL